LQRRLEGQKSVGRRLARLSAQCAMWEDGERLGDEAPGPVEGRKSRRETFCNYSLAFKLQRHELFAVAQKTYIIAKHPHCTKTCATPKRPAKHAKRPFTRQHPMSVCVMGRQIMLNSAKVLEVVPRSTNHGERPSEERREMMRMCCGR
jgi:hypothetical protein